MAESKFHVFHTTGTEANHDSCSVYTTDAEVKKKKKGWKKVVQALS